MKMRANPMRSDVNQAQVQRLRTVRGLSHTEMAAQLGVSTSALSRILTGRSEATHTQLTALALALGCTPGVLQQAPAEVLHSRPWLRAYADAPKKVMDQFVADTVLAVESFDELRLKLLPERLPMFSGDPSDEHEIDEFAHSVRLATDIEEGVVTNATRAAERLGCVVLPLESELGRHLGMSMFVNGTPVIRVARASPQTPGDRQRFTVAHELGHLTLHQSVPAPDNAEQSKAIEKQANRFAGAFLLPADEFLEDLDAVGGRVTLTTLSKLKARWGVAIKAMVVRLQQLQRIDADQARSLYKQISARGWNKGEPIEVENERAIWLSRALEKRFPDEADRLAAAARQAGISSDHFGAWTSWESQSEATVITFPQDRARNT